jgi:iron complex transport system ATP-binding protein
MAAEPSLWAQHVAVTRSGRTVLRDVALQVQAGEVLAVLGPNGAGKSSLLRALVGLCPYRGSIRVAGDELHTLSSPERARRIAFVPQASELRVALRVREVAAQGRYAHHRGFGMGPSDQRAIERALQLTDCTNLSERVFTRLSLGEQRRVLIARALCSEARVLCLDEPTAAFDVGHALRTYRLLRELAAHGHAIVVVLHQLDHALHHADRALLLHDGQTVCSGSVAEVVTAEPIRRVYGVELRPGTALGFELPERTA